MRNQKKLKIYLCDITYDTIIAVSKIVTRMVSLESQFRQVKNDEIKELRNIYKTVDDKWLTKYAMSG